MFKVLILQTMHALSDERCEYRKSRVRSAVEHVFAQQKGPLGLVVRSIGIARAGTRIGLANLAYNMRRFIWLERKMTVAAAG